jgi:hypothetical protein
MKVVVVVVVMVVLVVVVVVVVEGILGAIGRLRDYGRKDGFFFLMDYNGNNKKSL